MFQGIAPSLILLRMALGVSVEPQAHAGLVASEINFGIQKYHTTTKGEGFIGVPSAYRMSGLPRNKSTYIEKDSLAEGGRSPASISGEGQDI